MKLRYAVSFLLEIDGPPSGTVATTPPTLLRRLADAGAEQVAEAVTMLIDDELNAHHEGGAKCGVTFNDAVQVPRSARRGRRSAWRPSSARQKGYARQGGVKCPNRHAENGEVRRDPFRHDADPVPAV